MIGAYVCNVLIALDQLANAVLGGEPCDTISYRAAVARLNRRRWGCALCRFLDLFQRDHCGKTLAAEDRNRLIWGDAVERGEHPL